MQIPDEIRKCVVFLGYKKDGQEILGGTAFLLNYDNSASGLSIGDSYFVTAKHNLIKIQEAGEDTVLLRANLKNGKAGLIKCKLSDWKDHQNDFCLDVSVMPISVVEDEISDFDVLVFPRELFITPETVNEMPITIGNQIVVPGLFTEHYGVERNVSIIRCGNIAVMQEEKIRIDWFGNKVDIDAILVEMRSLGGLSGSPVFVYIEHVFRSQGSTENGKQIIQRIFKPVPRLYFLGIVHGHYDEIHKRAKVAKESLNMGIAIVVPVSKIIDVLEQPMLKKHREKLRERSEKRVKS